MINYHNLSIVITEQGNVVTLNGHIIARSKLDIRSSQMFRWDVDETDIITAMNLNRIYRYRSKTGGISSNNAVSTKKNNAKP